MVAKKGTFKSSDYWSLGVLLYEMLTGSRPDCQCSRDKKSKEWCPFGQRRAMEENALDPDGVMLCEVAYPPDTIHPLARDLLSKLLEPDPTLRLGAHNINLIKSHPYFGEIDWEALSRLEVPPPYVPDPRTVHAGSVGEVGEFSSDKVRHVVLGPEDEKTYEAFVYTSAAGVQEELLDALRKMDNPLTNGAGGKDGKGKLQRTDSGAEACCCTIT